MQTSHEYTLSQCKFQSYDRAYKSRSGTTKGVKSSDEDVWLETKLRLSERARLNPCRKCWSDRCSGETVGRRHCVNYEVNELAVFQDFNPEIIQERLSNRYHIAAHELFDLPSGHASPRPFIRRFRAFTITSPHPRTPDSRFIADRGIFATRSSLLALPRSLKREPPC